MQKRHKIAFIGAGSTVFMKNLIGDVLLKPDLTDIDIMLMDIDQQRLNESLHICQKLIQSLPTTNAYVYATTSQHEALDGADFVIVAFQIGGYDPCTIIDFDIPKKYGYRQTIADTLGIGGIMRAVRTIPHLWQICEDMTRLCPDATILQYVNPMVMNCWAMLEKYPHIKTVGLCHSVQNTLYELSRDLDIDMSRIRYKVAGINHMAFFLHLDYKNNDGYYDNLYPLLRQGYLDKKIPKPSHWNVRCPNYVRYEMMMRLGYFVTESSEHFAEYVPYFIKNHRDDLIEKFEIPLDEYPKRCIEQIDAWKDDFTAMQQQEKLTIDKSNEYAADIIHAMCTNTPYVIYGNVKNHGLISNLPYESLVEVPCLVNNNGVQPTMIGKIPDHLANLMQTNINTQQLVVNAMMNEDRDAIFHAAMLDPLTSTNCDLDQIWQMTNELIIAHRDWLPAWLHQ